MSILWFGGEMGSVVPSETSVIENTSGSFDSGFSRCAIRCPPGSSLHPDTTYIESPAWSAQTDIWCHGRASSYLSAVTHTIIEAIDGTGLSTIRVRASSTQLFLEYLNASSAWTAAGAAVDVTGNAAELDLHITISGSGTLDLYVSGTNRISVTGLPLSHLSGIVKFRYRSSFSYGEWSQLCTATESTVGGKVMTVAVTGAGATSDWGSDYSSVDETVYSDADFIYSATANQVELFAGAPVGSLSGYSVRAVSVTARANKNGSGPTQLQLALKSGATTYFSSTKALDAAYGAICAVWEIDPATSAAWTSSAATAIQFGAKSIA